MSVFDTLTQMLADPQSKKAAGVAALAWKTHDDDARLAKDLEFIRTELQARQSPEPEPVEPDYERIGQIKERAHALVRKEARALPLIKPVIERLLDDPLSVDEVDERLDAIEEEIKSLQQGSDRPLSIRWRGDWQAGVVYAPGDMVRDQDAAYVCIVETNERPQRESAKWDLLMSALMGSPGIVVGGGGAPGPQGPQGIAGPQNLFIQKDNPNMTSPGLWIELDDDGHVKSFWVETGA